MVLAKEGAFNFSGALEVHQMVPCLNYGDAVGNHVLGLRDIFRSTGKVSEIYTLSASPEIEDRFARPFHLLNNTSDEKVIIYHHCSSSPLLVDIFIKSRGRKVLVYHNVTPEYFFQQWSPEAAQHSREARQQTKILVEASDVVVADSSYNAREIESLYDRVPIVIPIPFQQHGTDSLVSQKCIEMLYSDEMKNFIILGRIAPNKKIEDALHLFKSYQESDAPDARLIIIGTASGYDEYYSFLLAESARLKLKNVVFTGRVSDNELKGYWSIADALLSMSEHEGFCVPLIEAMHYRVPIIAYSAGAIQETLGSAGLLLHTKDPVASAGAIATYLKTASQQEQLQQEQLENFSAKRVQALWRTLLFHEPELQMRAP